ncbi:kinase-like domain-containing protein, partial [Clohesyomyces aquaticus]
RGDFESIESIPDAAFQALLLQNIDPGNILNPDDCSVTKRTQGSYHYCAVLNIKNLGSYVIKVPAIGTPALWCEGDAHNLRGEARTMEYIRRQTSIPVPEVLCWDDTLSNPIGAPYIIMRVVEGKPAYKLWLDGRRPHHSTADMPSPELAKKRREFLRELANTIAELQHLRFDKIGMLDFDDIDGTPKIGHYWIDDGHGQMKLRPAYSSSEEYFQAKLVAHIVDEDDDSSDLVWGRRNFMKYFYDSHPFSRSSSDAKETFVLAHNDLDLQNILVDDSGKITGIIDWDLTVTVPRCIGYASLPLFLQEDWNENYDMESACHMPWSLDYYRSLYAEYMADATRNSSTGAFGDGKYTRKSHIYQAADAAM